MLSARSLSAVFLATALRLAGAPAPARASEVSLTDFGSPPTAAPPEFRSFDGTGNNVANPLWGSAGTDYARRARVDYADGVSAARLTGRPNPRSVGLALMRKAAPSRITATSPATSTPSATSSPTTPTAPTPAPPSSSASTFPPTTTSSAPAKPST